MPTPALFGNDDDIIALAARNNRRATLESQEDSFLPPVSGFKVNQNSQGLISQRSIRDAPMLSKAAAEDFDGPEIDELETQPAQSLDEHSYQPAMGTRESPQSSGSDMVMATQTQQPVVNDDDLTDDDEAQDVQQTLMTDQRLNSATKVNGAISKLVFNSFPGSSLISLRSIAETAAAVSI